MTSAPATAQIKRNVDGVVRDYATTWDSGNEFEADKYLWAEGNYACDCNRALFFARAAGEPDPVRPCGEVAFSVQIVDAEGKVLYQDDNWVS